MTILLSILNIVKSNIVYMSGHSGQAEERSGELSCCFVFIWARRGWRPRLSGGDIHLIPLPQWRLQNNVQIIKDKGWIVIPGNTRPAEILPTPGTWPGPAIISTICLHPLPSRHTHLHNTSTHLYIYIFICKMLCNWCCWAESVVYLPAQTKTFRYLQSREHDILILHKDCATTVRNAEQRINFWLTVEELSWASSLLTLDSLCTRHGVS